MSKIYEIIIFSTTFKDYADYIIDKIDPHKKVSMYRFSKLHTKRNKKA